MCKNVHKLLQYYALWHKKTLDHEGNKYFLIFLQISTGPPNKKADGFISQATETVPW